MDASMITALMAAAATVTVGFITLRTSTKANRPAESNAQLAWVKQAQDEAGEARVEAKEAKAESAAARKESLETQRQSELLRREFAAMQDWVDRVVRARDAYIADHGGDVGRIQDSGAIRLLNAINGGPRITPRPADG